MEQVSDDSNDLVVVPKYIEAMDLIQNKLLDDKEECIAFFARYRKGRNVYLFLMNDGEELGDWAVEKIKARRFSHQLLNVH